MVNAGKEGFHSDYLVLARQLNRKPRGKITVVKRCDFGRPLVILAHFKFSHKSYFSNLFWLSCPWLVKEVSKWEAEGWVKKFQERLNKDKTFAQAFRQSQSIFYQFKERLIELESNLPEKVKKDLLKRGIGGVSDWGKVKCLHAQYANWLVFGVNPIGFYLHRRIFSSCSQRCG